MKLFSKVILSTCFFTLTFAAFAQEPKATTCSADAILAASLIYKISDPKGYMADASTVNNPKSSLIEVIDDSEYWSISWKGNGESLVEYKVLATPIILNEVLYSCDVREVKKTIER